MELVFVSSVSSISHPLLPLSVQATVISKKLSSSSSLDSSCHFPFLVSRQNIPQFRVSAGSVTVDKRFEREEFPTEVRITKTKHPHSSVRLSVEVPPAVCQECYKKALDEYAKQAKVLGFRPGKKIPKNILVNYVGKQNVQHAAVEAILKRTLPQAMSSKEKPYKILLAL